MDFVFFDFTVFAILPDLSILDPLLTLDLVEIGPFLSCGRLDWLDFKADRTDFEATDFFPLVLLLNTVPLSYYNGSSS